MKTGTKTKTKPKSLAAWKAEGKKQAEALAELEKPVQAAMNTLRQRRETVDKISLETYYALGVALRAIRKGIYAKSQSQHAKADEYRAYWHGELELSPKQESEARAIADAADEGIEAVWAPNATQADDPLFVAVNVAAIEAGELTKRKCMDAIRNANREGKPKRLSAKKTLAMIQRLQREYELVKLSLPRTKAERKKWLAEINGLDESTLATAIEAAEAITEEIAALALVHHDVVATDAGTELFPSRKSKGKGKAA